MRDTYPPGQSGHISSGEERLLDRGRMRPTGHAAYAAAPRQMCPRTLAHLAGAGDPSPGFGKEWHVTVESGGAMTAALDQPADALRQEPAGLIQLLTPEGERIDHPDYPLDLSAGDIRAMYRDLVLVRRIDTEAISLQRQGELGLWASLLGQEAAQVGSGPRAEPAGHGVPHLPRARRGLVPRHRPGQAARAVPGRQPRRMGSRGAQVRPVHDRHRRSDPARDRLRDGHPARRRRGRGRRGSGDRLLR